MFFPSFFIALPYLPPRVDIPIRRGVVDLQTSGAKALQSRCLNGTAEAVPFHNPALPQTYPTTSMPIERAVPRMLLIAVSTEAAFRSGIFCLAMSSTCLAVTLPTLSLFGTPDPLAMPAARFNRIEAGGVLVMKVNERSLYTETTTGMISPSISFWLVLALNCLQNSMMLI